jgi:AGZA family xanthine/uracil permease-like MFS transporter
MLDKWFGLSERGTTPRAEVLAGVTTFLTMAYIVVVNPLILKDAGIDQGAAFVATCLAAALASAAMGLYANYPLALAPGMGLNAYFAYAVVGGMGVTWQAALGAVFVSGALFLAISVSPIRAWLVNSIPMSLKLSIAAGIGLFLGTIALRGAGVIAPHPATYVTLGDLKSLPTVLACGGFLLIAGLHARKVAGSVVIGVMVLWIAGIPLGLAEFKGVVSAPPSLAPTFLQMDIPAALSLGLVTVVFAFLFVDVLDNAGTLIGVAHRAGLMRPDGTVPRLRQVLAADSGAAMLGAALGTSTTTSYIESAAGVDAGGRTGLTALVVAGLFLLALFFAPIATAIPAYATAPALFFVACLMTQALAEVRWSDPTEYVPAVVTALAMPLTFSIAHGIGFGFVAFAAIKAVAGCAQEVSGAVWAIAAAFLIKVLVT